MWDGPRSTRGLSCSHHPILCTQLHFTSSLSLNCKLVLLSPHVPSLKSTATDWQVFWHRCFYPNSSNGSRLSALLPQTSSSKRDSWPWKPKPCLQHWLQSQLLIFSVPPLLSGLTLQGGHCLDSHVLCLCSLSSTVIIELVSVHHVLVIHTSHTPKKDEKLFLKLCFLDVSQILIVCSMTLLKRPDYMNSSNYFK